jgi:hypothetical protein
VYPNLDAELARIGWGNKEVAGLLHINQSTVRNKRTAKADWLRREMIALKTVLPGTLEYLFEMKEEQN